MESIKLIIFITLALSGCGLTIPRETLSNATNGEQSGPLRGTFVTLAGDTADLSTGSALIQVVMFVSETCTVCRAETQALVRDLTTRGTPTNVEFSSIVVGSFPEDAAAWKTSLNVSWRIGTDNNDPLFRTYCPDLQTPCVVLRNPIRNRYLTLIGEHSIADWETFTGTWEY